MDLTPDSPWEHLEAYAEEYWRGREFLLVEVDGRGAARPVAGSRVVASARSGKVRPLQRSVVGDVVHLEIR